MPSAPVIDDDDEPARLIVKSFELSAAQKKYQQERNVEPKPISFYKDAAPRVDHYMRCSVSAARTLLLRLGASHLGLSTAR